MSDLLTSGAEALSLIGFNAFALILNLDQVDSIITCPFDANRQIAMKEEEEPDAS